MKGKRDQINLFLKILLLLSFFSSTLIGNWNYTKRLQILGITQQQQQQQKQTNTKYLFSMNICFLILFELS